MIRHAFLRRHWREALLALVVALPWLSLLGFGLVWLWQGGHVFLWAGAALGLGLLAWPLRRTVRQRAEAEARRAFGPLAAPAEGWNSVEQEAWAQVLALADTTTPLTFMDREPVFALARQTVETVARRFHREAGDAWAHFTLPEALLLSERVSRNLRRDALRHIPGVQTIRLDHLLWAQRLEDRYGEAARQAWSLGYGFWRLARLAMNPFQAVLMEAKTYVSDQAGGTLSLRLRAHATRLLVLEVGRAAIDLYSGRLTLSEEELRAAREADLAEATPAEAAAPVRILLAGQVNAGKSSLLNALAQEARAAVGPVPTTAGAAEHLLSVEGRPAVVLVDTVGLGDGAEAGAALAAQAARADLILWVAAANQPARAPDRAALDALRAAARADLARRPAPILLALTHVDQLRPAGEWAPPYDVARPEQPKARSIRAALEAVARALDLPVDALVPVALRPGSEPYNIDALWARLALELGDAQLAQLDRLRLGRQGLRLGELAAQVGRLGRWAVRAVIKA